MTLLPLIALVALASEPPTPQPTTDAQRPAVHQRMAEHFLLTTTARAAVMRGDVDAAQAAGKRLSSLPIDTLPPTWKPQLELLTQAGRDLAASPSLEQSATALAQVVAVCADCHETTGGGLQLSNELTPRPEWTADQEMARHLWAAEWLWLGFVANRDDAVLRGAQALAEGPVVRPSPTRDPEIAEREEALHAVARRMVAAPDLGARRVLYGALLTECGTCHRALEAEGRAP